MVILAQIEETRSYQIFLDTLKSDATKNNYIYWLNKYLEWKKYQNHDELIKDTPDKIQTDIEDYVRFMKDKNKSKGAIKITIYALFHFFGMNRVILNERIIKKLVPEEDAKSRKTYSTEDVKKIIEAIEISKIKKHKKWYFRKPRAKALILFLASSGVRLGSIPDVKIGHLEKIQDCYCVRIYAETRYEYLTFLTPEATYALDQYLKTRKNLGKDDFLFQMNYDQIRKLISRLIIKAKIVSFNKTENPRCYNPKTKRNDYTRIRMFLDVPMVHGFRSRYNTIMKNDNTINKSAIEVMMGHTPEIKLDANYYKPTKEILFLEFSKGIEALTVYSDFAKVV